jgi:hypothetical protein
MSARTMQYSGLQMSLPEGWSDATQIVATGPVEDGFRSSLAYSSEPLPPGETPAQYAARMLLVLSRGAERFQLVSERPATFGKLSGLLREYTHMARGVKLAQLQFYVLRDGVVHTFTYTQRAERLQASRPVAEKLLASVSLGPATGSSSGSTRSRPNTIEPKHMRFIAA